MAIKEVLVPDIGNFDSVDVIEVHVKAGDSVNQDDSLITLESDKATMDVPSSAAGVVKEVLVKLGDKVKEGVALLRVEASGAAASAAPAAKADNAPAPAPVAAPAAPVSIPNAASYSGNADIECDMLVLGGGPQVADLRRLADGLGVGCQVHALLLEALPSAKAIWRLRR